MAAAHVTVLLFTTIATSLQSTPPPDNTTVLLVPYHFLQLDRSACAVLPHTHSLITLSLKQAQVISQTRH